MQICYSVIKRIYNDGKQMRKNNDQKSNNLSNEI